MTPVVAGIRGEHALQSTTAQTLINGITENFEGAKHHSYGDKAITGRLVPTERRFTKPGARENSPPEQVARFGDFSRS
jgi:hypothetical protein